MKRVVLALVCLCLARTASAQKAYQDTFTRTAGNLAGSTSSDGLFTWTVPDGTDPGTNGTAVATSAAHPVFTALTNADCDTDAIYAEVDFVFGTGATALWIDVASNSSYPASGNGYEFAAFGGNAIIFAVAGGAFTQLATVAHTVSTGTYRAERNGATLTFKKDGATLLTTTDSSEGTGGGKRRAAFGGDGTGAGSSIETWNEFRYGDIGGGPPPCKPTLTLLGVGRCG